MSELARASNNVWDECAHALVNCARPVITWAQRETGLQIGDDAVPAMLSLDALTSIVRHHKLPLPMPDGQTGFVDLAAAPAELVTPLQGYLGNLPCYDPRRSSGVEQPAQARVQHSYVLMHVPSVVAASLP